MRMDRRTKQSRRLWADSTINRHFAYLRRVFSLAVKDKNLSHNPLSCFEFFDEEHRVRYLNDDELQRLRGVISSEGWLRVQFAIETGLRQSEQFGLRWDCVDLERGLLILPMPKQGETHEVPLTEAAKVILRSFESFPASSFVFPAIRDPHKPLNPDCFLRNVYRLALRKAGIRGATWHTLRHTAASRRVMAGVDLSCVMQFLGHANYETTLRYAHLAPEYLQSVVRNGSLGVDMLTPIQSGLEAGGGTGSKIGSSRETRGEASKAGSGQPLGSVQNLLVRPEGLEPPTPRSVVWCSIH